LFFLALANAILLSAGWMMALYAYPRLPESIPMWMNFLGQQILLSTKSLLFFLYPASQTLFCFIYGSLQKIMLKKMAISGQSIPASRLKAEFALLSLIFFNLLFIHLQRSIILTAHGLEEGVSEYYFFSLFGIILALIPYYRIRGKILMKKESLTRGRENNSYRT